MSELGQSVVSTPGPASPASPASPETGPARRRGRPRRDQASELRPAPPARLRDLAGLMGFADETLEQARQLLDLLGDPGRRTLFEMLASAHQASSSLNRATAMTTPDVMHRIRSLERRGAVRRHPTHLYRLDPEAAKSLASYFDLLALASAAPGSARGAR